MWSIPRLAVTTGRGACVRVYRQDNEADWCSFVEFETGADLKTAVSKLDGQEFKGAVVHCTSDVSPSTTQKGVPCINQSAGSR